MIVILQEKKTVSSKPTLDVLLALEISCGHLHYLRDYEMQK